MDANPKRIKKDAFSNISGYVWTGPESSRDARLRKPSAPGVGRVMKDRIREHYCFVNGDTFKTFEKQCHFVDSLLLGFVLQ